MSNMMFLNKIIAGKNTNTAADTAADTAAEAAAAAKKSRANASEMP